MGFRIYHNIQSMNALRNLDKTQSNLSTSLERLISGLRVNTGKDDPAGLVISEKFRAQISGLGQAIENAENAVSLVNMVEGALNEVNTLLVSIRELAVHAANEGANDDESLAADQAEIDNALATIDRISSSTQFGKKNLLDGTRGVQGTPTDADVTFVSGTEDTIAGTYAINITTQAEQATVSAITQTGNLAVDETVTIMGVNIGLTTGMSAAQVVTKINEYNSATGVTASLDAANSNLVLTMDNYGSAYTVTAVSTVAAGATSSGIGTTVLTDDGVDIAGEIGAGLAATGVGNVLTGNAGLVTEGLAIRTTATGTQGSITVTQGSMTFQVGANAGQTVSISMNSTAAASIGTGVSGNMFNNLSEIDVTSTNGAQDAMAIIDKAIDQITNKRGEFGAFQKNTLEIYINTLKIAEENLTSAESIVRDTDFAREMADFTKNQILAQSGAAMLTQANQLPQLALQMFG
jgi:flagellin